ncbi:MAG: hypothetical protein WCA81_06475 [Rhizomicrobium sp.]
MISRSALLISGALLFAMLVATIARLMLLPDWTHIPFFGPGGMPVSPMNSLGLIIAPSCVLFVGGGLALRKWLSKASPEAARSWTKWGSFTLIVYSAICTALQFFILTRSLGVGLALNPTNIGRAGIVLIACLLIVLGNDMPKLPWLETRIESLNLDPARGALLMRFNGRMVVLMGIAFIIVACASPTLKIAPWVFAITAAGVVVVQARRLLLRRDFKRERDTSKA